MRIPILFSTAAAIFLTGCETAPKAVSLPNGNKGIEVTCGELRDCYEKAAKFCKSKYLVVDGSSTMINTGYVLSTRRALIVECTPE